MHFDEPAEPTFVQPVQQPAQQKPKPAMNKTFAPRIPVVQQPVKKTENLNKTAPTRLPPNANLFTKEEEEFPAGAQIPVKTAYNEPTQKVTYREPFSTTMTAPVHNLPSGEELPLLEELGIDVQMIQKKLLASLTNRGIKEVTTYNDMTGPVLVVVIFGMLLLCVSTNKTDFLQRGRI